MARASDFSVMNLRTPAGILYLQSSPEGLRRCAFLGSPELRMAEELSAAHPNTDLLKAAVEQLGEYFQGARHSFSVPLNLSGLAPFQTRVLIACAEIPWGETRTYAQLAGSIASPGASRAVGSALARNPLLLFIPCHRVIGSDGALRGFAAPDGIRTKAWLLQHEGWPVVDEKTIKPIHTGATS
ncbi:MAG: methylated-DNA--[protein]-cysteine S-methyltransferase [Anaerolineaceae bacterium]